MEGGGDRPGAEDVQALHDLGYGCVEHGIGQLAIRPLARALELAPDCGPVLSELVATLERGCVSVPGALEADPRAVRPAGHADLPPVWSALVEHFVQPFEHDAVLETEVVELAVQDGAFLGREDPVSAG